MFNGCSSLKELNLFNFDINHKIEISGMFYGCSDELIKEIKFKYKNITKDAFEELIEEELY